MKNTYNRTINDSHPTKVDCWPLRSSSSMDSSVVERLRATVEMSAGWANDTLDVLIRLDDDLLALDEMVRQRIRSLRTQDGCLNGQPEELTAGLDDIVRHSEKRVQLLRNTVRDVMISMQHQDVIGQAVERAATALEQRVSAIGRVLHQSDFCQHCTDDIAKVHHAYQAEDDPHRPPRPNAQEYNKAA